MIFLMIMFMFLSVQLTVSSVKISMFLIGIMDDMMIILNIWIKCLFWFFYGIMDSFMLFIKVSSFFYSVSVFTVLFIISLNLDN